MNSAAIGKFDKTRSYKHLTNVTCVCGIRKNCRVIGNNDRIEIWNEGAISKRYIAVKFTEGI